jgi:hypothetical protein
MNVGRALRPGRGPPFPVLGREQVRGSHLVLAAVPGQQDMQLPGDAPPDIDRGRGRGERPRAGGDHGQHSRRRALRDRASQVGWRPVRRCRADGAAVPGRGPVVLAYLEQQRVAVGGLTVDRRADQQPLRIAAQHGQGGSDPIIARVVGGPGHIYLFRQRFLLAR